MTRKKASDVRLNAVDVENINTILPHLERLIGSSASVTSATRWAIAKLARQVEAHTMSMETDDENR